MYAIRLISTRNIASVHAIIAIYFVISWERSYLECHSLSFAVYVHVHVNIECGSAEIQISLYRRWISLVQDSEEMKMQFTGKDIVSAESQTMRRVIHTHIHKPHYHHAIFCRTRIVHGICVWSMAMCSLHILVIISHLFISRQTWLVCHVRHISLYTESSGPIQMIHARTVYIVYHIEEAKQRIQE